MKADNVTVLAARTPRAKSKEMTSREALELRYAAAKTKLQEEGLTVTHRRYGHRVHGYANLGGLTMVYRQAKNSSVIEVATAVCSRQDNYCRKLGTCLAVERFLNERVIQIP